jgi:hypothetical protein
MTENEKNTSVRLAFAELFGEYQEMAVVSLLRERPAGEKLTARELRLVVEYITHLNRPDRLRTNAETFREGEFSKKLCRLLGFATPEDVFDRYGRYGSAIIV